MNKDEILKWLKCDDPAELNKLWDMADNTRKTNVGEDVHLRGLIEFSNHCTRMCGYCGINAGNKTVGRYRMTKDEIIDCAGEASDYGYGTVVMQSGEDYGYSAEWLEEVILAIKLKYGLAVTLSVGERDDEELKLWKQAGADRFLLRFETSNNELYNRIHPPLPKQAVSDRFAQLRRLREIGYEIGSGVMIGIPGQTWDDLANDIIAFGELDLDMIGVGPYIPHPAGEVSEFPPAAPELQVPNTEEMTYRVVALARLMCPAANIPSTSALATLNKNQGRELGLQRGANIVMPNLTPIKYRAMYEIYPAKACINETAKQCHLCMQGRIVSLGRAIGKGRGDSPHYLKNTK